MARPTYPSTPTRMFQPMGIGNNQQIHDLKWASRLLPAGALAVATNFFGAAPSSDPNVDRYEQGNTLVSSAKTYTIFGIGVQIWAGAAATLSDLEKVVSYTSVRIVTAQKEYGVFPTYMLPGGGGLAIQSGQIALTPGATPGVQSVTGALNGMPARNSMFNLAYPLEIQANQAFYCELIAPNGTSTVIGAQTLTGAVIVKIVLDGVEQRAAA